jgi:hypothetical protein
MPAMPLLASLPYRRTSEAKTASQSPLPVPSTKEAAKSRTTYNVLCQTQAGEPERKHDTR